MTNERYIRFLILDEVGWGTRSARQSRLTEYVLAHKPKIVRWVTTKDKEGIFAP